MPSRSEKGDSLGNQTRPLQVFQLPRGVKLLRTIDEHPKTVLTVAFDPSGQKVATGSYDKTVRLWEVQTGNLLRTYEGHKDFVRSVAFDPKGRTLASGSDDRTVKLWDVATGNLLLTLRNGSYVYSVAYDPMGRTLAIGSDDRTVKLWDVATGNLLHILEGHKDFVRSVAFDPTGQMLASGSYDRTVKLWDVVSAKLLRSLDRHESTVYSVAFNPGGQTLASGSDDRTIKVWEVASGRLLRTLEGHTNRVEAVAFSSDGQLMASKSHDDTLRLWSCLTWETVAVITERTRYERWIPGLAFHPTLPLLATVGSTPGTPRNKRSRLIHFWKLDFDVLLGKAAAVTAVKAVHHTTAKIVLVGDSGVGKTGLGWRLTHGGFKEHASTHGQQFWVLDQLGKRRADGTECEAILWDLAGQPDYRLTHALFLDDADLALVLFDPTDSRDPLHGVEFWLKQLNARQPDESRDVFPIILVGARADRGAARLTPDELDTFCRQRSISGGYVSTSASRGDGLQELLRRMQAEIRWDQKPATVTTVTFKRIKDYVLGLKENHDQTEVVVTQQNLSEQLEKTDSRWEFTIAEMMTAVGHLANYGYVRVLRTSKGQERILLLPELLNNLAASFVLEARRNQKGLGSLEERRLLIGDYNFRELESASNDERNVLLDAVTLLFLEHNICFRETDPLTEKSYLVFPELINLRKPILEDERPTEDGVAYAISGAIENVYASLVVLLGYTQTFTRTDQWRNQARYEVGERLICGFRQEGEREGELDLVLYFGANVGRPVRTLFQGLFESFLARRNLNVFRYGPVRCPKCSSALERVVVRTKLRESKGFTFCNDCGEKLILQKADEPIQLTQTELSKVNEQRWFADQRTRFEQAVFQVTSYVESRKLTRPECFVSYAWGNKDHERWVERNLAADLQKAGVGVLLDRWENERVGANVMRFVERIQQCDKVIVVGTPAYSKKYANKEPARDFVIAAEGDLIAQRMLSSETKKESVLPVLLAGEVENSLPPWLHGRVYADFRKARDYFIAAFDLILDIYGISHGNPAVADLRESLDEARAVGHY